MVAFYTATIVPFIFGLLVIAAGNELAIYWQIKTRRTPRILSIAYLLFSLCFLYLVPALALSVFWREVGRLNLFAALILLNYFDFLELKSVGKKESFIVAEETEKDTS